MRNVICIDNKGYDNLTVGKEYPVLHIADDRRISVRTDYDETNYLFDIDMFIPADKPKISSSLDKVIRKYYECHGKLPSTLILTRKQLKLLENELNFMPSLEVAIYRYRGIQIELMDDDHIVAVDDGVMADINKI